MSNISRIEDCIVMNNTGDKWNLDYLPHSHPSSYGVCKPGSSWTISVKHYVSYVVVIW